MLTAWQLNPAHSGAFVRLRTLLEKLQGFHTIIAQHNNPAYRDGLIQQLTAANADTRILDLKTIGNFNAFEAALSQFETGTAPLQVINLESLGSARRNEFFRGLNYHREHIARQLKTSLVLWMVEPQIRDMALQAPDFWAWREKVFEFSLAVETQVRWEANFQNTTGLDREKKQQRIQEILDYLEPLEDEEATISVADMLHELGNLYFHLGEYTLAKQSLEQAHHHFITLDEKHAAARVLMDLADLQSTQGEPAEALALLENKVLPCFKELDDLDQQAEALDRIANIETQLGNLKEALQIRQEKILPIIEATNNLRNKSVTMGKIADILQARGELDEALSIRQNDQLPVYEKLGDVRGKAVTMGKIADILQARGQLDEALNIRQNDILPIFEKLGDVRAKAVTMGKIADILEARGQLDDALNALQNDVLPIFEKLGDVREKAATMGRIADILWQQDPAKHAETIRDYLNEALGHFQTMQVPGETKWIEGLFSDTGLPRQGDINPKLFLTLNTGDILYPKQYESLFKPEIDDAQREQAGLHRIDIHYYSGKKQLTLWTGFTLAANKNTVEVNAREFLDLLITSVSLDTESQKNQIISGFSGLSQYQIDELTKVFTEEQAKFIELGKEHPQDTDTLQDKMVRGWLIWEESQAPADQTQPLTPGTDKQSPL